MTNEIIHLVDKPKFPIGSSFQMTRNAWSREVITATVETARWTAQGYIHTLKIDTGKKYQHWRVMFEGQISQQMIVKAAA